jgi:hypothetical protein
VATDLTICQAVPEARAIGAVLEARIRKSASANLPAAAAAPSLPPEVRDFKRRLHQSYVFAIEEVCKDIVVPVLASPIRPMVKKTFHTIRGTKD